MKIGILVIDWKLEIGNWKVHEPVLLKEILGMFDPKPDQIFVDATINGGGHASAILKQVGPGGRVLGIDRDCALIEELRHRRPECNNCYLDLACASFADIYGIAKERGFLGADGVLFDLGFSSYHIEQSGRGFSFLRNEPLDMRYDPATNDVTAEIIINTWTSQAIENVFRRGGEERFSGRIARAIVRHRAKRPIRTTEDLVSVIWRSIPAHGGRSRRHPATKVFQSLRMEVNGELDHLHKGLEGALAILRPGGKLIVISFHSLEDRMVKNYIVEKEKQGSMKILTKKPIRAPRAETIRNPRARSAKLRAAEKMN